MLTGIKMPALSAIDDRYTVTKIHSKPGDNVKKGTVFLEVECEKGTLTVGHYFSGLLTELNVAEGQSVRKNELLGVLDTPD